MSANVELRVSELQHRMRGGYQLLQALVGIRLRSVTDPESRRHLGWLSDVVAAMGLLNERLQPGGAVDFSAYLTDAIGFWRRACDGRPISFELRAADRALPESHALPLAIIAHELIGNAVRHGFPDDASGTVLVHYADTTDGVSLLIRDSGVGAAALEIGEGLALVAGLADHLGGSMQIEAALGAGVGIRVRLPLDPSPAH